MVAQGTAMPRTAMAGMKVDPSLSTVCFQTHYTINKGIAQREIFFLLQNPPLSTVCIQAHYTINKGIAQREIFFLIATPLALHCVFPDTFYNK
jgi:hypothetical protein